MSATLPPVTMTGKRLETASAAEYAEMHVNRACIVEAMNAFKYYFARWRAGEPGADEEEIAIRLALFRDGLVQIMAVFTTNPDKRDRFLIPSEAFAGTEGWEEYYQWILGLRDCFAAPSAGAKCNVEPVVMIHPDTAEVERVGHLTTRYHGEGLEAEQCLAMFCKAALRNVDTRLKALEEKLLEEAKALSPEERAGLMNAQNVIPGPEDIRTGRTRYRKKTKDAQRQREG